MLKASELEGKAITQLELIELLRPAAKRSPLPKYKPRGFRHISLSETISQERLAKP